MENKRATNRILVIEDQEQIRDLLVRFLQSQGYDANGAENGLDGLFFLEQWPADLVTVDLNMPEMGGHEFIERAVERWPSLPIVVVSGVDDVEEAVDAMRVGACDFITKPIRNFSLVKNTVVKALETADLRRQNHEYQRNLEVMVELRTRELEETKRQLLYSLGKSAEYRDNETGRHVIRVGKISELLGQSMGMEDSVAKVFGEAAPLHDIGKIGISDSILLKPGRLTEEERNIMQTHCEIGCDILRNYSSVGAEQNLEFSKIFGMGADINQLALLEMAMVIALCHHEKWDGTGYPCHLKEEEIPLIARITSVVDVYDALGSERPYKKAFPEEKCLGILKQDRDTFFDPLVVDAFFDNLSKIQEIKREWMD